MQQAQQGLERVRQRAPRAAPLGRARRLRLQHRLGEFQVPVAELVPGELVGRLGREVEAIAGEALVHGARGRIQAGPDPAVGERELLGPGTLVLLGCHQHVAGRVPQLVAEVAVALDAPEVEAQVARLGGHGCEGEAQRVGPVGGDAGRELLARRLLDGGGEVRLHEPGGALGDQRLQLDAVDDVQRIDDVALGLRHLLAFVVTDQAMHIDLAERHLVHELQSHHDHPGDPEKDDVETGDQH